MIVTACLPAFVCRICVQDPQDPIISDGISQSNQAAVSMNHFISNCKAQTGFLFWGGCCPSRSPWRCQLHRAARQLFCPQKKVKEGAGAGTGAGAGAGAGASAGADWEGKGGRRVGTDPHNNVDLFPPLQVSSDERCEALRSCLCVGGLQLPAAHHAHRPSCRP